MKNQLFHSVVFLGKVAVATLLPLIVFGLTARIIDTKLNTSPWLFIVGCLLALFTTVLWLRVISKKMFKKMNELK